MISFRKKIKKLIFISLFILLGGFFLTGFCHFSLSREKPQLLATQIDFAPDAEQLKNPRRMDAADLLSIGRIWSLATYHVFRETLFLGRQEKPLITFFGGHRVERQSVYYRDAFLLSQRLAKAGCAIITGGYQGVMEAGNCGAASVKGEGTNSIGIGVDIFEHSEEFNSCAKKKIIVDQFFPRNWLLMHYSSAIVIFPGGIGTVDELANVTVRIAYSLQKRIPIYVIGNEYWKNFRKWFTEDAVSAGMVSQKVVDLVTFTDDIDEVEKGILNWIREHQRVE